MTTNHEQPRLLQSMSVITIAVLVGVAIASSPYFFNPKTTKINITEAVNEKRLSDIEKKLDQIVESQQGFEKNYHSISLQHFAKLQQQIDLLKNSSPIEDQSAYWLEEQNQNDDAMLFNENMEKNKQQSLDRDTIIEEAFAVEDTDKEWSVDMVTKIDTAFQTPQLSMGQLVQAVCRSTMCLIEYDFNPSENQADDLSSGNAIPPSMLENEVIIALSQDLPTGAIQSTPNGDGSFRYTMYFAKKGHLLPEP